MVPAKISLSDLAFDFQKDLTDVAMVEFPMACNADALPHEPPLDWEMKAKWTHLFWTDDLEPPSLQGLEGISFSRFNFSGLDAKAIKNHQGTALPEGVYHTMVAGRANFVLEDYCHIPKEKGY